MPAAWSATVGTATSGSSATPFPDADQLQHISLDDAAVLPRNERFKYSNIGYSLLGQVIEAASGLSYAQYVDQHIVEPLGLTDTGPELDPARAGEYAVGYSALSYGDHRLPIDHVDTRAMASATGFYSTATDVVRYAAAHFMGDDRLLTDEAKRQMQRTEWEVEGTGGTAYGLGSGHLHHRQAPLLGHGGGYPGHITRTYFDPVDQLAVSVMTNAIDGPAMALATAGVKLIDMALGGRDDPPADDSPCRVHRPVRQPVGCVRHRRTGRPPVLPRPDAARSVGRRRAPGSDRRRHADVHPHARLRLVRRTARATSVPPTARSSRCAAAAARPRTPSSR